MRKCLFLILAGCAWLFFLVSMEGLIRERSIASVLSMNTCSSEGFRSQRLSQELFVELAEASVDDGDWIDLLTASMLDENFFPAVISRNSEIYMKYKEKEYKQLRNCYRAVWEDLQFFPVAGEDVSFENTWMAERSYGGERFHEGTDLFGSQNIPEYYPIISMTDGVVERIGWLPLGGLRIGIRSPAGGYFYYAHLSSYEKNFQEGDTVAAGDILGYMGNTGYGPEGTMGKFPVHLHLGIYIATPDAQEMSVNPYWILKIFRKNIRNYLY